MNQFLVPCSSSIATNHIQVSINYFPNRKAVFVSAYPAEVRSNGITIVEITRGTSKKLEDMSRLNKKQLEKLFLDAKNQVNTKNGIVYDIVMEVCRENNLTIK